VVRLSRKKQNGSNEEEGLTSERWEEDGDQAEEEVWGAHFEFFGVFRIAWLILDVVEIELHNEFRMKAFVG
jgi:hypothetical protein